MKAFKKLFKRLDAFTLLIFTVCVFFIYLGFWQIDRAHEKKIIISSLLSPPISVTLATVNQNKINAYQKVELSNGYWLSQGFIKKNVVKDGILGMQIYGLYCQKQHCIIVNFGWLSNNHEALLNNYRLDKKKIVGVVRPLPYVLIKEKLPLNLYNDFGLIVSLDVEFFSKLTGKNILPYEMLLDQSLTHFQQLTSIPKVTVARHYGYAVQFYLLALVLVIGYIYLKK